LDDLQPPRVFASFGRQRLVAMALALRVEGPRVVGLAKTRGTDRAVRRVTRFVGARHSRSAAGDAFGQLLRIRVRRRVSCVTDAPACGAGTAFA
jgi:hypothetical protein